MLDADVSTTVNEVTSTETDGVNGRAPSDTGVAAPPSELPPLEPPDDRPLRAATYTRPRSPRRSVRISSYGESSRTKPLPAASTRSTRPGVPVPTSRLPAWSKVNAVAWVALVS